MLQGDQSERRAIETLVGRRAELERLEAFALGTEPLVMYVQGIPKERVVARGATL